MLQLKSCCGVVSVKTGTFFIALYNQAIAIIGFVSNLSILFIMSNQFIAHGNDEDRLSRRNVYLLITCSMGLLLTAGHIVMGSILIRGLQKEKPTHLIWYLKIGSAVIIVNFILIGCSAFFISDDSQGWYAVLPAGVGIVIHVYFMLVIRSAYREMVEEEKMFAAARNNL